MVLHSLEYDNPIARRFNDLVKYLKAVSLSKPEVLQLVLYQPLARFFERPLHFADTHCASAALKQALLDHHFREIV
jgi:hypothetical protein